jgi:hypothetical protein
MKADVGLIGVLLAQRRWRARSAPVHSSRLAKASTRALATASAFPDILARAAYLPNRESPQDGMQCLPFK